LNNRDLLFLLRVGILFCHIGQHHHETTSKQKAPRRAHGTRILETDAERFCQILYWGDRALKRLIPFILFLGTIAAVAAISLVNVVDRTIQATIPVSYPAPPPKPTMTITLRIGENFTKKLTLDIPTEEESSWQNFTIKPDTLNAGQEIKCRILAEWDAVTR
jgi:hypothetical protein